MARKAANFSIFTQIDLREYPPPDARKPRTWRGFECAGGGRKRHDVSEDGRTAACRKTVLRSRENGCLFY